KVLIDQEGTVIALPKTISSEPPVPIESLDLRFPKHSLPLKAYATSMISEDLVYAFSIVIFLFILAYAVEIFTQKRDLAYLTKEEQRIIQQYNLPATSIQIRSIIASLQKIQKEQLQIRDRLEAILHLPLKRGEYFQKLEFGKKISFEVALLDPKRAEELKSYLVKKCRVSKMSVSDKTLYVECQR
ncbi:MAG: hypothetical protein GXO16_01445, partial [Epsilonproteobacteria bacterium]|nr:hypothetical protein [Campylobacterota bacterium]